MREREREEKIYKSDALGPRLINETEVNGKLEDKQRNQSSDQ